MWPSVVGTAEGEELPQEHFVVLCLDTQNRVAAARIVTRGLLNTSLVHPREVFIPALLSNAASVIAVHNHPSGDPDPSPEDIDVTQQLTEAGRILGIPLRDHVIVGDGSYVSLLEKGLLIKAEVREMVHNLRKEART